MKRDVELRGARTSFDGLDNGIKTIGLIRGNYQSSEAFKNQLYKLHGKVEDIEVHHTHNEEFFNIPLSDSQFIYVFNLKKLEFQSMRNLDLVLGYDATEFTFEKYTNLIHPDDRKTYNRITLAALKFSIDNPPGESGTFYITFRVLHKLGHYIKVLCQGLPYQIGSNGIMLSNFNLLTNISFMNTLNNEVRWELRSNGMKGDEFKEFLKRKHKDLFSQREIEIILLLKKGLTSMEIAQKIHLSKHTIDTHRRNMRKKINGLCTMDVINYFDSI